MSYVVYVYVYCTQIDTRYHAMVEYLVLNPVSSGDGKATRHPLPVALYKDVAMAAPVDVGGLNYPLTPVLRQHLLSFFASSKWRCPSGHVPYHDYGVRTALVGSGSAPGLGAAPEVKAGVGASSCHHPTRTAFFPPTEFDHTVTVLEGPAPKSVPLALSRLDKESPLHVDANTYMIRRKHMHMLTDAPQQLADSTEHKSLKWLLQHGIPNTPTRRFNFLPSHFATVEAHKDTYAKYWDALNEISRQYAVAQAQAQTQA